MLTASQPNLMPSIPKGRLAKAFTNEKPSCPPIWLMRQAGRYLPEYKQTRAEAGSFLNLCYNPKLAAEVAMQPLRRFDLDATILFSDILVIPHGLGQPVRFEEGIGPILDPIGSAKDLADFNIDSMLDKLSPVYETVDLMRSSIDKDVTLIGFTGAPWTVATYMLEGRSTREFITGKTWAYGRQDEFAALIDLLVEAISAHLCAQVKAGAEILQIFDTWAGIFDDWGFKTWVEKPIRKIISKVKAVYPNIPILVFARGAGVRYDGLAERLGADGLSMDCTVPLDWGRDVVQAQTVIQGNLDPIVLTLGGDAMKSALAKILDSWAGGRFIFNLGHGIPPQTPPEHVAEMVNFVRNYDYG